MPAYGADVLDPGREQSPVYMAALLPALKASAPSLVDELRGEAPVGKIGRARFVLRDALVVSQVSLTAVLLVVAGLLLRSLGASQHADVGFDLRGLAAISLDTGMVRYDDDRSETFWREALTRVRALPGVTNAGLVTPSLPFTFNFSTSEIRVDSRNYSEGQRGEIIQQAAISPTYLDTLGVTVSRRARHRRCGLIGQPGRDRDQPDDGADVLAEGVADRAHRAGRQRDGHGQAIQVVGVTRDHKQHGVLEQATPNCVLRRKPAAESSIQIHSGPQWRQC